MTGAFREKLSSRELEVLRLLAAGLYNREIGKILCIEIDTVKNHVANILMRLDALNRTHAVAIGYERGILRPTECWATSHAIVSRAGSL
jgi:DNA-binding NarL/FixJ family response regulator